jgi:hypothetical protein
MLTKSISQVSARAIAFIDSQVEEDSSLVAGVMCRSEAEVEASSQIITVDVIGDRVAEPNKTITVTLSNPVALNPASNLPESIDTNTIIDDEILKILSLIQLLQATEVLCRIS